VIWRKAAVKGGRGLEEGAVWTKAVIEGGRGLGYGGRLQLKGEEG
jgi:hypothetical protein